MPNKSRLSCRVLFLAALPLGFLAAATDAQASGLSWDQRVIDISARPDQAEVAVDFTFHNSTKALIGLSSIETGCTCTTAHADHLLCEPGRSGRIHVVFQIGDFTGLHEEPVTVTTDEPAAKPDELLLRVRIPQDLLITPRIVIWPLGGKAEEKTVTCVALPGKSIVVTRAIPSNSGVTAWVETIEAGKKYHVHLKPASTAAPAATTIQLAVTVDRKAARPFNVYASVAQP